jgi:hypothetical protein
VKEYVKNKFTSKWSFNQQCYLNNA